MKLPEILKQITEINRSREKLFQLKSNDYADTDGLSNFKRMNTLCSVLDIDPRRSPADCALFLLMLKVDRWCNLRRQGKAPKNEAIIDTVTDLHNYADLVYLNEKES